LAVWSSSIFESDVKKGIICWSVPASYDQIQDCPIPIRLSSRIDAYAHGIAYVPMFCVRKSVWNRLELHVSKDEWDSWLAGPCLFTSIRMVMYSSILPMSFLSKKKNSDSSHIYAFLATND
jgi:hypothetical protein